MASMMFRQAVTLMIDLWLDAQKNKEAVQTPILLLGPPGVGKTSAAKAASDAMTRIRRSQASQAELGEYPEAEFLALDLSSMLPEDLGGVPFRAVNQYTFGEETLDVDVTRYAVQEFMAPFCAPGAYGVLCLDDITQANPAVQVAARQLVLFRRVGKFKLSDDVMIVITGNRREDKAGASTLPSHFRNSCCILGVKPTNDEWYEWYSNQKNMDQIVPAYLRYRPGNLIGYPKDADKAGAFPTPRSWAKLGRMLPVARKNGLTLDVASGLIGQGMAVELEAFINVKSQLVNPGEVLMNPKRALPNPGETLDTADKCYAMMCGLGEIAGAWRQDDQNPERAEKAAFLFLKAVAHASKDNREYFGCALQTFKASGGSIADITDTVKAVRNDPDIKPMIEYIMKTQNTKPSRKR